MKLDVKRFPQTVLHHLDTPTICAVNGGAAGFGMDLALACDVRIAARSAKLAAGFTRRGMVADSGGTWLLPRLVGWARAAEIIFAGRTLHADECLELGLVNRVVDDAALMESAHTLADEFAANAPLAVQAAKRMMRAGLSEGLDEHIQRVYLQVLPLLETRDFREGLHGLSREAPAEIRREIAPGDLPRPIERPMRRAMLEVSSPASGERAFRCTESRVPPGSRS